MEQELKYKNSLKDLHSEHELVNQLCGAIKKDFNNIQSLELDVELIRLICNKIEKKVFEKQIKKANKLEYFDKIYSSLFGQASMETNKKYLFKIIEYLHDNNRILSNKLFSKLKRYLKKLLLGKK